MENILSKRKVAVLIGQLSYYGGVGIAAVNEVRELRQLGVEAELVVIYRKAEYDSGKIYQAEDIPIVFLSDHLPKLLRINFKFPVFSFFSLFHITSILWAPLIVKRLKYKLIIAHETYNCFAAISSAKYSKAKLISYVWDPISYIVPRIYCRGMLKPLLKPVKAVTRLLDWIILKNSDLIFIGSDLHKKRLLSIYDGADYIKIPAATAVMKSIPPKRQDYVIALTKWDQGKKPDFLIEVVKRLDKKTKLVIAGDWSDLNQKRIFEDNIKKNRLDGQITVIGKVSEMDKFKLFSQARVLIHPIVEAFGMFALEAAACGCPYILPRNSGVNELFDEGTHAFFPEEGNVDQFVKYAKVLLDDERLSYKMGREAWKRSRNYSWQEHAKSICGEAEKLFFN